MSKTSALAAGAVALLALTGCADGSSSGDGPTTPASPSASMPMPMPIPTDTDLSSPLPGKQVLAASGTGSGKLTVDPLPGDAKAVTFRVKCRTGTFGLAVGTAKPFFSGGCVNGAVSATVPRERLAASIQVTMSGSGEWFLDGWAK